MKTVFSNSTESVTDKCIKENARFEGVRETHA